MIKVTDNQTTFAYYPGCSLHATGKEYNVSLLAVMTALDVELRELDGWNCCGASSAHSLNLRLGIGLPARNLALIEQSGLEAVAPCAACFNHLKMAQQEIAGHPQKFTWLEEALGTSLSGTAVIRSPISLLLDVIGLEKIAGRVKRPLAGLPVVTYYGCLLARPRNISELGDTEHPHELDDLMQTLGAEPQQWSYAVDCCGGALSIARADIVQRMTQTIVNAAREAGAALIITACPLCQINLEMRQTGRGTERLPALYFSEAMGLSFDLPGTSRWWKKHLVDPRPVLRYWELV
jgi:heterodisulfide reductase subunit B